MKRRSEIVLLLLFATLLWSACVKREWNNPFDPNCPKDYWTPTNVLAVQEGNIVKLTWSETASNISGFKISRSVEASSTVGLPNLDKSAIQMTDATLIGGKIHTYSITAYAGNNQSDAISVQITPVFAPTLTVPVVVSTTSSSLVVSNTITSDGGAVITARGVCWSTVQNPTILDSKTNDGTGNSNFNSTLSGLSPGTVYYLRTYAINSAGTSYSSQINSTTNAVVSTISTSAVTSISANSATCGGTISSDGGAAITSRGVCWNQTGNPTITDSRTTDGTGAGSYTSSITGLAPGTMYYAKAYSVNSVGISYGTAVQFTTLVTLPVIATGSVAIQGLTATCAGTVSSEGGATVTARGICWSTGNNPSTSDSKTSNGTGAGDFSGSITGLTPNVTYYVRAYAVNILGTSYGSIVQLMTSATLPIVTTANVSLITSTTATCGGNVTSDGGVPVTVRGVCWSTNPHPTTSDAKTSDGTGTGTFQSSISSLTQGSTYFIRAYAVNSLGTVYGSEISLLASLLPSVSTMDPASIGTTNAQSGGSVTADGGSAVTARGVCWSTNQNPTISDSHTVEGNGIGTFISQLSGLTPNTNYYLRAYATNAVGTSYGNQANFSTSFGTVSDADGNVYQTIKIGNQVWLKENLRTTKYNDGTPINFTNDANTWANASSGEYCWYGNNAAGNKIPYGALYNGYTIASNKLAPVGCHIPTLEEWNLLLANAGGNNNLLESGTAHWLFPNSGNNLTGFSARPGGICYPDFSFYALGSHTYWWTTALSDVGFISCTIDGSGMAAGSSNNNWGLSVRCIVGTLSTPVVSTTYYGALDIFPTYASVIGYTTNVNGPGILSRGICWNITGDPSIADSKTIEAGGYGSFTSKLSGLTSETTYYCRAYATNSNGTSYGSIIQFTTASDKLNFNSNISYGTVADIDGNIYKTVAIGSQTWFAENLRTTHYNDGSSIPQITDKASWCNLSSGAYCFYGNDATYGKIAGALYNWYTTGSSNLCPNGWRVPSNNDWMILANLYGDKNSIGIKIKESGKGHWFKSSLYASNESGFTAIPTGIRWENGEFTSLNEYSYWWTSTLYDSNNALSPDIYINESKMDDPALKIVIGLAVRCIKN